MSEITIRTGSVSALPTQPSEDTVNQIYISTDEPAMYVDTIGANGAFHRLRLSDFPHELYKLGRQAFAAENDDILFDISRGDDPGPKVRTLKRGKLPTFFSSSNRQILLEYLFNKVYKTVEYSTKSGETATSNKFKLPTDIPLLIQVLDKNCTFTIQPDNGHLGSNYMETFFINSTENKDVEYQVQIHREDAIAFGADVPVVIIRTTERGVSHFDGEVTRKLKELETKIENLKQSLNPLSLVIVDSALAMNQDVSKIYLYLGVEDGGNYIFGHLYIWNDKTLQWNDLGQYVNSPVTDLEERLQALEALGLTVENGVIQESFSFENLLDPVVATNIVQYPYLTNFTNSNFIFEPTNNNLDFNISGSWQNSTNGYRLLRGYGTTLLSLDPGTYLFKLEDDLPSKCEINVYNLNDSRVPSKVGDKIAHFTTNLDTHNDEIITRFSKKGNVYNFSFSEKNPVTNKIELVIIFKTDNVNLSDTPIEVKPRIYLLKGGEQNPLLLDRTGEEILEAIKALETSEEKWLDVVKILANPSKYIGHLGETTFAVLDSSELLTITNQNYTTSENVNVRTEQNSTGYKLIIGR